MGLSDRNELWGCISVPHFAAQAMLRMRPRLQGKPVVVIEGVRPSEHVFSLNAEAAACGLRPGMTRVEVETFGEVAALARTLAEEQSARTVLLEGVGFFTPRVEERPCNANWEAVLDLSGTERLFGTAHELGEQVYAALAKLGFAGCVVICSNADAGISLARGGRQRTRAVASGDEAGALAVLPVEVLGLTAEQSDRFATWGVATLGRLAALPEVDLIARMGQAGHQLRLRARGELPHVFRPMDEAFLLEEILEFEEPVETLEPLLFCMNGMLQRLIAGAQERTLALASVQVSLWLERPADRNVNCVSEVECDVPVSFVTTNLPKCIKSPATEPPTVDVGKRLNGRTQLSATDPGARRSWQSQSLRIAGADLGDTQLACSSGKVTSSYGETKQITKALTGFAVNEARWGMSSASEAVRKAWHRARLVGEVADKPPIPGEGSRRQLGIGHGQAMRRAAAMIGVVAKDKQLSPATVDAVSPEYPTSIRLMDFAELDEEAMIVEDEKEKWGNIFERTIRPAIPVIDQALLLKMLQLDLEGHQPPGYVVRLRLTAETGKASHIQLGLFSPPIPEATRFEDTYARLVSLVGEVNVGRVCALDTYAAENFILERFLLPSASERLPECQADTGKPHTALRRVRPPREIRVALHPWGIERFWLEGVCFAVQRSYGPWRTSGNWWQTRIWSLDEWDIASTSETGELLLCLVGRDLLRNCWLIEGFYD